MPDPATNTPIIEGTKKVTGWMGWDTSYRVDPATGAVSGPYAVSQVTGCAVTLIVAGVLAARVLPVWILTPVVVIPFAASWSVSAADSADSGAVGHRAGPSSSVG